LEHVSLKKFGQHVRRLRETAELTQEELAAQTGCHPTYIAKIEAGHRLPSLDTIVHLARALHVPPGDIIMHLEAEEPEINPGAESIIYEIVSILKQSSLIQLRFVRDFLRLMMQHSR